MGDNNNNNNNNNNSPPIVLSDVEKIGGEKLAQNAWNYYSSGADGQQTLSENKHAFDRLRIRPRMLRGISNVDTSLEYLGRRLHTPIFVAPSAMQKMAHQDGELGTAMASQHHNTCMGLSTLSTCSYEQVARSAPDLLLLMQLYVYKNRDLSVAMIRRAEVAGFKAIVLTVDTPVLGQRIADVRHKFKLPQGLKLANLEDMEELADVADADSSGLMAYVTKNIEPALSTETIAWLKSVTKLCPTKNGVGPVRQILTPFMPLWRGGWGPHIFIHFSCIQTLIKSQNSIHTFFFISNTLSEQHNGESFS